MPDDVQYVQTEERNTSFRQENWHYKFWHRHALLYVHLVIYNTNRYQRNIYTDDVLYIEIANPFVDTRRTSSM